VPDPLASNTPAPRAAPAATNLEEHVEHRPGKRLGLFRLERGPPLPSGYASQSGAPFRWPRLPANAARRTLPLEPTLAPTDVGPCGFVLGKVPVNDTVFGTSRSEPRKDVVCGRTLMTARSNTTCALMLTRRKFTRSA
jgi:hypothetical protein